MGDFSVGLSWGSLNRLLSSTDFHFSLFFSKLGLYFAQLFLGSRLLNRQVWVLFASAPCSLSLSCFNLARCTAAGLWCRFCFLALRVCQSSSKAGFRNFSTVVIRAGWILAEGGCTAHCVVCTLSSAHRQQEPPPAMSLGIPNVPWGWRESAHWDSLIESKGGREGRMM